MNKFLLTISGILMLAVVFLFITVFSEEAHDRNAGTGKVAFADTVNVESVDSIKEKDQGFVPTGRIAFVNIDELNEQSLEILDLVDESKRRQGSIEASVERLRTRYQQKVEEFQRSQRAGIAPESELMAKAREIEDIEREAANKQIQMDNLTMEIAEKNENFQRTVRDFLDRWNGGRYDFILSYSETVPTMLLGNQRLEVTKEVITELNNEYRNRKSAVKK